MGYHFIDRSDLLHIAVGWPYCYTSALPVTYLSLWPDFPQSAFGDRATRYGAFGQSAFRSARRAGLRPRARDQIYRYKLVRGLVERLFANAVDQFDKTPQLVLPLTQEHPPVRPVAEYGELFSLGARRSAKKDDQRIVPGDDVRASRLDSHRLLKPISSDDASATTPSVKADWRTFNPTEIQTYDDDHAGNRTLPATGCVGLLSETRSRRGVAGAEHQSTLPRNVLPDLAGRAGPPATPPHRTALLTIRT